MIEGRQYILDKKEIFEAFNHYIKNKYNIKGDMANYQINNNQETVVINMCQEKIEPKERI